MNKILIWVVMALVLVAVVVVALEYSLTPTYSYTFSIQVNYSGDWKLTYWGSHLAGCPPSPSDVSGYYLSRTLSGQGSSTMSVTLSGASNQGLSLSALAQKLDSSNATLVLDVNNVGHNSTSLPYGSAYSCSAVVP